MNDNQFWQQKIIQFFHDPPAKPYASYPGSGGHRNVAKGLFEQFMELALKYVAGTPDWASAGADRPLLTVSRGEQRSVHVYWPKHLYITHPLSPNYCLDVRRLEEEEPQAEAEARKEPSKLGQNRYNHLRQREHGTLRLSWGYPLSLPHLRLCFLLQELLKWPKSSSG